MQIHWVCFPDHGICFTVIGSYNTLGSLQVSFLESTVTAHSIVKKNVISPTERYHIGYLKGLKILLKEAPIKYIQ